MARKSLRIGSGTHKLIEDVPVDLTREVLTIRCGDGGDFGR